MSQPDGGGAEVSLRQVEDADLEIFFEDQRDPAATAMAAFPARDRAAHREHWRKILADDTGVARTVLYRGEVAGNLVSWPQDGERAIGYWISRRFWGRGIASRALAQLVALLEERPLRAYVAVHNTGSIRVLEKCGFTRAGTHHDGEIEELLMRLDR